MKTTSTSSRALPPRVWAFSALGAYFAVLLVGILINGGKASVTDPDFIVHLHPLVYAATWLVLVGILLLYGLVSRPAVYGFAWVASVGYAVVTAASGGSYFLTFALCGLVAVMSLACGRALRAELAGQVPKKPIGKALSPTGGKLAVGLVAALAGGGVLFLLLSSYLRYTTTPTTSTGVYIQLMESLRSGFSFATTLEFGETVSHLAAHISPIFLVYLPFYALIPSPVTLLILQTLAVFSAVIPLWRISRHKGLSPALSAVVCGLLCLFPAVWEGAAGSLHEYALLLPLLLWLLWALETNRRVLPWVFALLVLCVRETCAIHLFAVGLYHLASQGRENHPSAKRERYKGLILMGASLLYFATAMVILTLAGKGTLITRFDNVTGPYGTFFDSLLRELVYNPAIAVYEMLTEAKLHYVLCLLLPLGLIPLCTKRKAGLAFLIPLLTLNLLSDFPYHFRLDFPYSFGIAALALYLCADGLATLSGREDRGRLQKRLLTLAVCFTLIVGGFRLALYAPFASYTFTGQNDATAMAALLDAVEPTESVSASGHLIPALAAREEVYALSHGQTTDVVVLDLRAEWKLPAEDRYTVEYFEKLGYTVANTAEGVGVVLRKK